MCKKIENKCFLLKLFDPYIYLAFYRKEKKETVYTELENLQEKLNSAIDKKVEVKQKK